MSKLTIYTSFGRADFKNVSRDDLLAWIMLVPFIMAFVFRFGVPALADFLQQSLQFDLVPYYDLIMSFYLGLAPGMIGMISGFLLLDERDDGILSALMVTPISFSQFLLYRTAMPLLIGFVATLIGYPIAGLAPLPFLQLVMIVLLASFSGPIFALFLALLAENKVAGFAIVKILNSINILPVAAYFVAEPLQWIAGLLPTYWMMKLCWMAADGTFTWIYVGIGFVVNLAYLWIFVRWFRIRSYQ